MNINSGLDFFPLEKIRDNQEVIIRTVEEEFKTKDIVILEAPVGSGKSAIAIAFARLVGENKAHILTPRKALQDQYFSDFGEYLVLMKGRGSYPCTYNYTPSDYSKLIKIIKTGSISSPGRDVQSCAGAVCESNDKIYKRCTISRPCPYNVAMELAQMNNIVVHNLSSFIYQSYYGEKFDTRELMIVDEAHEIESTIRDFITREFYFNRTIGAGELPKSKEIKDWISFLLCQEFIPEETSKERLKKESNPDYLSVRDKYFLKVNGLKVFENENNKFSIEYSDFDIGRGSVLKIIPHNIGGAANSILFSYGKKLLLMSGTIYSKDLFCRYLGLDKSKVSFIRVDSNFPIYNRPIYILPKYQVNTSHLEWNNNFPELIDRINKVLEIFKDARGLIHSPSYNISTQLFNALNNRRCKIHTSEDFLISLSDFYEGPSDGVFISPICQQGVDFKDDRARFQIIVRVPYLNVTSKFIRDKLETDPPWYNYQSLIIFGQQIGRINRSKEDFGATFLLDSRFNKFISRNRSILPSWLTEALVYK